MLWCTKMRGVETRERLDQKLGKSVIRSKQTMMHETLLALEMGERAMGFGTLPERPR